MAKNPLLPIFLVVFMDLLGLTIAIPVVAPLFLDPGSSVFASGATTAFRTMVLGILLAAYPAAQFFGAPIIGGLSDHHGRKKMLLLSIAGTCGGYLIFAAGILTGSLPLLFLGRILDGFTGGNISIALSAIADVSDDREKSRNFGMIGMAFGLGFIIGPFVGGKLADPSLVSWFDYSTPFLFAALLSALNMLLLNWRFEETIKVRSKAPLDPFMGIRNVRRAFSMPNLRTLFAVTFLITLGFNFFTQFFPVFLIEKFGFTESGIGDIFAYIGFWVAVTQGVFNRFLSSRFGPERILKYSTLLLSAALILLVAQGDAGLMFAVLTFVPIMNGLTYPNFTALVSNQSGRESQGEVLGINQSVQSVAQALPPIIAGFIVAIDVNLPIVTASLVILAAWAVFAFAFSTKAREKFHEA
jgi:DHA1 family tetracycline resistance protein-like MFS transporter